MRVTGLLLLLVSFAAAVPVPEDADQQNIMQMLLNADPYENDILDNSLIELPKNNEYKKGSQEDVTGELPRNNEYKKGSQEDVGEELTHTTEYLLDSGTEIFNEPVQETEPKTVEENKSVTESETESDIKQNLESTDEVESVPEVDSNNTTNSDSIIETEQQLEPNINTETVNVPNERVDIWDYTPESPQYVINFSDVIPELDSTDQDVSSEEDDLYSNQDQEWPQRYAPGSPNFNPMNGMIPEIQQYGQPIPNIPLNPQMSSNMFVNQEFPLEYVPEIRDSDMVEPIGPAYQLWDMRGPEQFVPNEPIVDTFPAMFPDPGTFNMPEVNQFGGDGMAHESIEDIAIEPIFFSQEPVFYANTPEPTMNEELPEEMLEQSDVTDNLNVHPKDTLELIVVDEEIIDLPQTPIAGEAEQPQDSPIIPTAILQDTRPEVDIIEIFDDSEDEIIPERIEQTSYPLEEVDFEEEYLPTSDVSPYQTFDRDVITPDNNGFSNINTPELGEDDSVLDPFAKMPPLMDDFEHATIPNMPIIQELSITAFKNDQFSPMNENQQRIYFENEVPENLHIFPQKFQSESDFMGPHSHDQFSFGNDNYEPHSHNEDAHYHNDIPHTHHDHQYNFDNFPQNNYFEDVSGTRKRDGAHIVPDVEVFEFPMLENGDMGIFNSPIMGPSNTAPTPQITVILGSKQQVKNIWSQLMNSMQRNNFSPLDMSQSEVIIPYSQEETQHQNGYSNSVIMGHHPHQFDNMRPNSQNMNNNQFSQNFYGQNINQRPLQNFNMDQNMNFPQNQIFNSGMSPFTPNFNQQPNMGDMFPNINMDFTMEDLEQIHLEDMEREQMFASQQPMSPYGPSRFPPFSANRQNWPSRYAPNYPEYNYGNNGQFYHQHNMNRPFFIPS